MRHRLIAGVVAGLASAALTGAATAQPAAPQPLQTPNPHYESIVLQQDVDRPAAAVWARVGKYCDIAEWFSLSCTISSGKDGELGAVRLLNGGGTIEILVAKTDLSYTYTQPVRTGLPYNLYHGTLEVKPTSATTSRLVYSLVFDNSTLDDTGKAKDREQRTTRFTTALRNMKVLAEGGTLPKPAAAPAR